MDVSPEECVIREIRWGHAEPYVAIKMFRTLELRMDDDRSAIVCGCNARSLNCLYCLLNCRIAVRMDKYLQTRVRDMPSLT